MRNRATSCEFKIKRYKSVYYICGSSIGVCPLLCDEEYSDYEERWLTLGLASNGQHLVVIHTMTQTSKTDILVRIISARVADSGEQRDYMEMPR
jgi:uncharacterized DUF497 family protein